MQFEGHLACMNEVIVCDQTPLVVDYLRVVGPNVGLFLAERGGAQTRSLPGLSFPKIDSSGEGNDKNGGYGEPTLRDIPKFIRSNLAFELMDKS